MWRRQNGRDKAQQMTRREAHREDVQNISMILRNQSLANFPKPNPNLLNDNKEEENEDEEMAWKSLGASLGTTQAALDGEKRRERMSRKTKRMKDVGPLGQPK
jgi:hypothetical protein